MINIQQILASDSYETMINKINQGFVQLESLQGGPKGPLGNQGIPGMPGVEGLEGLIGEDGRPGTRFFFKNPPEENKLNDLIKDSEYEVNDTFIVFNIETSTYDFYKIIETDIPNEYSYQQYSIDLRAAMGLNIWVNHLNELHHWSVIINNDILSIDENELVPLEDINNDNRKHFTFNTIISSSKDTNEIGTLNIQTLANSATINEVLYWTKNHFKLSLDQKLPYNLDKIKGDDLKKLFEDNFIYKDIRSDEPQQYLNMWDSYSFGNEIDLEEIDSEEDISLDDFNVIKNTSPILYLQTDSTYFDEDSSDIKINNDREYSNFGFLIKRIDTGEESQVFKEENGRYKSVLILASDNNDDNDMYFKLKNIWSEGNFISEVNQQNRKNNKRFYTPFVSKCFDTNGEDAYFYVDEDQYVYYGFGDYGLEKYDESEITNTRKFDLDSGLEFKIGIDENENLVGSSKLKLTKTTINTESTIERDSNYIMVWEYDKVGVNLGEEDSNPEETLHMNGNLRIDNGEIKIKYANNNFWNIQLNGDDNLKIVSDNNKTLYIGSEEKKNNLKVSGESTFNDNVKIVNSKLDVDKETTIKDNVKIVDSKLKIGENNNPLTSLHLDKDGSILAQDNDNEWDGGNLGTGTRLMWIPHKSAFRAGTLTTGESEDWWNSINIGDFSFASGRNVKASGYCSVALGNESKALGYCSFTMGNNNESLADFTFSLGRNAKAIHEGSFVFTDSQYTDFESEKENQFRLRFDGGYDFQGGVVNFEKEFTINNEALKTKHITDFPTSLPTEETLIPGWGIYGDNFDGSSEQTWKIDEEDLNKEYLRLDGENEMNGKLTIDNDLIVNGDLTIQGNAKIIYAEHIYTSEDTIKLRDGADTAIIQGEISGLKIENYDGNENDLLFGTSNDGWFKIGKTGDLQKIATIEDGAIDNKFVKYNATENKLESHVVTVDDIVDLELLWSKDENNNIYTTEIVDKVRIGSDTNYSDYKLEIINNNSSLLQIRSTGEIDGSESVLRFLVNDSGTNNEGSAEIAAVRTNINQSGDRNLAFRTGSGNNEPIDKMIINHNGDIITKGLNWTESSSVPAGGWNSVTYGNGLFVAIRSTAVMYSSDSIKWFDDNVSGVPNITWGSVTYGNGLFVAVGTDTAIYSSNGINWNDSLNVPEITWSSVTYGNELFVAVGTDAVMYSSDGINWTDDNVSGVPEKDWYSITYENGLFVAVGNDSAMYSSDGINWTESLDMPNKAWYSTIYGNGLFVAVGDESAMYSSNVEEGWIEGSGIPNITWRSVTYGNGLFVAVGDESVMYSSDGINWIEISNVPDKSWQSITYGNGLFAAVTTGEAMYSGKQYQNIIPHNNIYHGGMKITGDLEVNGDIIASGEIESQGEISDIKLKKNIKPLENSLEIIDKLNPISFEWNETAQKLSKTKKGNKEEYGLIAQETEEILPNIINNMYNGQYKGIDYEKIIPFLINSVKELKENIENTCKDIEILKTKNKK